MCDKYLKVFIGIAVTLTLVNWVLGSLIVRDKLPAWAMALEMPGWLTPHKP
jgi:hypothetical protein